MNLVTNQNKNDILFRLGIMLGVFFLVAGIYTYTQVFGGTTIGKTITSNPDLESGLVGHWTFDGEDMDWGSTTAEVKDRSGNDHSGNATNFDSSNAIIGKVGQGLQFDGSNDRIDITDDTDFDTIQANNRITMSAWINTTDTGVDNWILTQYDGASGAEDVLIGMRSGKFGMYFRDVGAWIETTQSINDGTWHHVTGTYDGTAVKLYVDAEIKVNSSRTISMGASSEEWSIADDNDLSGTEINAALDDIRLYNRALSVEEISRLYELGATTHIATTITSNPDLESGLVGHWTFDGSDMDWSQTTGEVRDRSGNNNHGNTINLDSSAVVPGKLGQGADFDGNSNYVSIPDSASLDTITDAITISAWVHPDSGSLSSRRDIIQRAGGSVNGGDAGDVWWFNLQDGGKVSFYSENISGGVYQKSIATIPDDRWTHVIVTYNDVTDIRFYINGEIDSVTNASGSFDIGNQGVAIASRGFVAPDWYFAGKLDDIRLYNRALSTEEVSRLYELGATTHIATTINANPDLESGLVGHWTFDGEDMDWSQTTAEARDRSGSDEHGNVINFDSSAVVSGKVGQGIVLDGADNYVGISENYTHSAFTICEWINMDVQANNPAYLFNKFKDGNDGWGVRYSAGSGLHIHDDIDGFDSVPYITLLDTGRWYHICAGIDSRPRNFMYVDGVLIGDSDTPTASLNSFIGNFFIGQRGNDTLHFKGGTDDVRIYNRALSADEVRRLYDLGL